MKKITGLSLHIQASSGKLTVATLCDSAQSALNPEWAAQLGVSEFYCVKQTAKNGNRHANTCLRLGQHACFKVRDELTNNRPTQKGLGSVGKDQAKTLQAPLSGHTACGEVLLIPDTGHSFRVHLESRLWQAKETN